MFPTRCLQLFRLFPHLPEDRRWLEPSHSFSSCSVHDPRVAFVLVHQVKVVRVAVAFYRLHDRNFIRPIAIDYLHSHTACLLFLWSPLACRLSLWSRPWNMWLCAR